MISTSSIHYRVATVADAAAIIEIVNAAFAIEQFFDGTRTDPERMQQLMSDGQFLVAEDGDGRIVASIYVELRGERGYLGMLAVDPARQGQGLAHPMMETGENYLRRHGCKFADLTVLSLRPELPPIYRRWGYTEIGTREFQSSWRDMKPGVECHCVDMAKSL